MDAAGDSRLEYRRFQAELRVRAQPVFPLPQEAGGGPSAPRLWGDGGGVGGASVRLSPAGLVWTDSGPAETCPFRGVFLLEEPSEELALHPGTGDDVILMISSWWCHGGVLTAAVCVFSCWAPKPSRWAPSWRLKTASTGPLCRTSRDTSRKVDSGVFRTHAETSVCLSVYLSVCPLRCPGSRRHHAAPDPGPAEAQRGSGDGLPSGTRNNCTCLQLIGPQSADRKSVCDWQLKDNVAAVMDAVGLLWTRSEFYCRPRRTVVLLQEICNLYIQLVLKPGRTRVLLDLGPAASTSGLMEALWICGSTGFNVENRKLENVTS